MSVISPHTDADGPAQAADRFGLAKVVIASFLGLAASGAPILIYTQSLFLGPMTQEFGWSRSEYFAPLSFAGVLGALVTPFIGAAADKQGVRLWLLGGTIAFAAFILALAFVDGRLWLFAALVAGAIVASCVQGPLLYCKAVSDWPMRRPGLTLACALAGASVGAIIMPPLATYLIEEHGWRTARVVLGVLVLAIAFPPAFAFIRGPRNRPTTARARTPAAPSAEGASFAEAVRSGVFYRILLGVLAAGLSLAGLLGNMKALISDRGLSTEVGAAALSVFALAQILGRFISGMTLDRIQTPKVGAIWFLAAAPGAAFLGLASDPALVLIGAVLAGIALSAELELGAYFTLRFFGRMAYGKIYGLIVAVFTIGATSGPLMLGFAYDMTGGNQAGVILVIAGLLTAAALFLSLGRYRYPVAHTA